MNKTKPSEGKSELYFTNECVSCTTSAKGNLALVNRSTHAISLLSFYPHKRELTYVVIPKGCKHQVSRNNRLVEQTVLQHTVECYAAARKRVRKISLHQCGEICKTQRRENARCRRVDIVCYRLCTKELERNAYVCVHYIFTIYKDTHIICIHILYICTFTKRNNISQKV